MSDTNTFQKVKPLTKGLGFHPKKVVKKVLLEDDALNADGGTLELNLKTSASLLSAEVPFPEPKFQTAGSFDEDVIEPKVPPHSPKKIKPRILESEFDVNRSGHGGAKKLNGYRPAWSSLSALFIDSIFVSLCFFVVCFSILSWLNLNMFDFIKGFQSGILTRSLIAFGLLYFVVSRAFLGRTLGEWATYMQLGSDSDRRSKNYTLKVILRTLLTMATGIFLVPLLSSLMKKDFASYFGGLGLHFSKQ